MFEYESDSGEVPLLKAYPVFQRLILGSFKKKQYSHTKSQMVILLALSSHDDLTMSRIAQYISSSNEQATRAVAPLVEEGYVERSTDTLNRTHVLVRLTEKGREYVSQRVAELRDNLNIKLTASLTKQERLELKDAVETVITLLDKVE